MIPNKVVIALGSNIEPEENLELAVVELKSRFKVSKRSRWIRTKPIGILDQPDFYNGVLVLETELGIGSLKEMGCLVTQIKEAEKFLKIKILNEK